MAEPPKSGVRMVVSLTEVDFCIKWVLFFLGPWLLVYQFIDISNQIEANGHVSNFGKNNLCNSLSYKKIVFEV